MYEILADSIVIIHFLFIAFVIFGGLLAIRWPRTAYAHVPAAIWGAAVEFFGWLCPLTPIENHFRSLAGRDSYGGDFIKQYLLPVIYPENLTASVQQVLGMTVIAINFIIYFIVIRRRRRKAKH